MAYPPSVPPSNRVDTTPQFTNHPADHNMISAALSDIINELGPDPGGPGGTVQGRFENTEVRWFASYAAYQAAPVNAGRLVVIGVEPFVSIGGTSLSAVKAYHLGPNSFSGNNYVAGETLLTGNLDTPAGNGAGRLIVYQATFGITGATGTATIDVRLKDGNNVLLGVSPLATYVAGQPTTFSHTFEYHISAADPVGYLRLSVNISPISGPPNINITGQARGMVFPD